MPISTDQQGGRGNRQERSAIVCLTLFPCSCSLFWDRAAWGTLQLQRNSVIGKSYYWKDIMKENLLDFFYFAY